MGNFIERISAFYRLRSWYLHLGLFILGYVFAGGAQVWSARFWLGFLLVVCHFAHGYSFNTAADSPAVKDPRTLFGVFLPLLVSLVTVAVYFPECLLYVFLVFFLNAAYSLPSVYWKGNPFSSVAINCYLFGVVFLFGVHIAGAVGKGTVLMSLYMALFFAPAQIVHEMSHADADFRRDYIARRKKGYAAAFLVALIFQCLFVVYLFFSRTVGTLFLFVNLAFWGIVAFYFFKARMSKGFSPERAGVLRGQFKYAGIIFGICCLLIFVAGTVRRAAQKRVSGAQESGLRGAPLIR